MDENDESFTVKLTGAENATIDNTKDETIITIEDNDPTPSFSFNNVSVTETEPAFVEVTLSNVSAEQIIVNYATEDGTAVAPGDYMPVSGQLISEPGEIQYLIGITTREDRLFEDTETFKLKLMTEPDNPNPSDAEVIITIKNSYDSLFYDFITTDEAVTLP